MFSCITNYRQDIISLAQRRAQSDTEQTQNINAINLQIGQAKAVGFSATYMHAEHNHCPNRKDRVYCQSTMHAI